MSRKQFKILIADSDPCAIGLIKKWMKRIANSEILEAHSGSDAIVTTQEEMPDIVILDVSLDDTEDGYQVIEYLKEDPRTKGIPIILLSSSHDEPYARAKALSFGAYDYIAKPFYGPDLLARVRTVLACEEIKLLAALLNG